MDFWRPRYVNGCGKTVRGFYSLHEFAIWFAFIRLVNDSYCKGKLDLHFRCFHTSLDQTNEEKETGMPSILATLPHARSMTRALFALAAKLFHDSRPKGAALKSATANPAPELNLWQVYRLTAGFDSISPKVAAELRRQLVGR